MDTNLNGQIDQEDLNARRNDETPHEEVREEAQNAEQAQPKRKHHHEDHHINRKYRIFSNHSSYGDSPHTNTSF